jgi:putative ABC transport system substrate-binding protein
MAIHIRRRQFMVTLGAAVAWPLAARAQQAKAATIGLLGTGSAAAQSQWTAAFVQRMRELGWVEGRNLAIEYRWAEGRTERLSELASELVRLTSNRDLWISHIRLSDKTSRLPRSMSSSPTTLRDPSQQSR